MTPSESPSLAVRPWDRGRGIAVVGLCFAGFVLGQIVSVIFVLVAASAAGYHGSLTTLSKLASPPWWFVIASLVGLWVGFGCSVALIQMRFRAISIPAALRARWSDARFVLLGVGLQFVVVLVYLPLHLHHLSAPVTKIFGSARGWQFALLCVMTALCAPIVEEFFFRGALFPALRSVVAVRSATWTITMAVLADGILFGLAHGEWVQLPALAAVGAILAVVYWRTQRLIPSIMTHVGFNSVAVLTLIIQRTHS